MFVPLFLTGGSFGTAFGQSIVHSSSIELYAAVGMASFISAGYKTPLAAAVFVAEATGGHAFIIPALIGSAVAYAVSGDSSVSGDQHLHEGVRVHELRDIRVGEFMQRQVVSVQASMTLREFANAISPHYRHSTFLLWRVTPHRNGSVMVAYSHPSGKMGEDHGIRRHRTQSSAFLPIATPWKLCACY